MASMSPTIMQSSPTIMQDSTQQPSLIPRFLRLTYQVVGRQHSGSCSDVEDESVSDINETQYRVIPNRNYLTFAEITNIDTTQYNKTRTTTCSGYCRIQNTSTCLKVEGCDVFGNVLQNDPKQKTSVNKYTAYY